MTIRNILKLGNPDLFKRCEEVGDIHSQSTFETIADLKDTLLDFKMKSGFGRGIAAPQIGNLCRIVYLDYPRKNLVGPLINPEITWRSTETFELWDDCFSFPDLLVKVARAKEIKVEYLDLSGKKVNIHAENDLSELLQHEIDHLDGILAVQRAINNTSFALKSEWEKFLKN